MAKKYSEDIQKLLMEVVDHFDKEDIAVRERQIRTARRLKLFWEGFQRTWYSEVAHDWRVWDQDTNGDDTEQSYYDKPVNVFRAYLESIIAALSVTVPPIKCFPDDADSTLDLSTARAGDKIAELVFRHNNVPLLWIHALFIYCTEGMVACYSYPKSDESYGTYESKEYDEHTESQTSAVCPSCGFAISEDASSNPLASTLGAAGFDTQLDSMDPSMQASPDMMDPNMMGSPDMMGQMGPNQMGPMGQMGGMNQPPKEPLDYTDEFQPEGSEEIKPELCPGCGQLVIPDMQEEQFVVTRLVGVTKEAKTRICMEAYGGLYVKIANYAKKQCDSPYLIYSYETHYANAIERFEHLHGNDNLTSRKIRQGIGPKDPYEQWGRLSPQYQGEYPQNTVTMRNAWLRPCAFNILNDRDDVAQLKKLFPNGVKVCMVNDEFGEACPEALDDCWTLTLNPLSDYITHDPIGLLLVSIQEITNDLISLTLQTIEHGIGQTFADPAVLDFNGYRQLEALPGGVFEATPKSGKSLADSFYEVKTATLSQEVMPFSTNIQSMAQLVSGALPSLFGGALEGSETASQYSMSRAQALQRLQNVWKMFTIWWKEIFGKVIPAYIKEIQEDEKDVQKDTDGNFINVFIRRAELEGKIGKVELEANENLPLTWSQKKDLIMELLQAQNPEVLAILGSSENLPIIREAIGLTDFYVPGEDSRNKQYDEIKLLLTSEPMPTGMPDPMTGQPGEQPSIPIDADYDEHNIEFEIVCKWVRSDAGQMAKLDNPNGYRNVLLHGKMHLQVIQFQQMQQAMAGQQQDQSGGGSNRPQPNEDTETPITGEGDVQTIQ